MNSESGDEAREASWVAVEDQATALALARTSLVGSFEGTGGGHFPGIAPFTYGEVFEISFDGRPFLVLTERTWNLKTGSQLHRESGYLRFLADGSLEFVVAAPVGVVEVCTGSLSSSEMGGDPSRPALRIDLESLTVVGTPTASDVVSTKRRYELVGDDLSISFSMATPKVVLTNHLEATLSRLRGVGAL